jgi:hypothetical protein
LKYIIRFSFFYQIESDLSKIDQNGSNLIKLDIWRNNHWNISSDFQLDFFLIDSDLSKRDQNGSNLIKLDFWWNNYWNISSDFQLYSFFDQIESALAKMNQTWSNWISDEIIIEIHHQIFNFIIFYQVESDLSKIDQNGSNLIKFDFWWNNYWNISSDFQLYLFFDQIKSALSRMDQNGSNLIKLNFWWNNHWNTVRAPL